MEDTLWRTAAVTAVAPAAWGTTYIVSSHLLPPDRPLFAAVVRALPAGLVLLAVRRRRPHGIWWWRALALGVCNIGLFFPLIFLAAFHLPGGLAATLQATSPLVVMGLAWAPSRRDGSGWWPRSSASRGWPCWSCARREPSTPSACSLREGPWWSPRWGSC